MGCSDLKENEKYYMVDSYSMKCRLYPNKQQAEIIDRCINAIHIFHNMALYDMFVNLENTRESVDSKTGDTIHFPDLKKMSSSAYIKKLKIENSKIESVPASAISTQNGVVNSDIKRMLESQSDTKHMKSIENSKPLYYMKKKPRCSYTYQETMRKILPSDNKNVFYINLAKVGKVKVRGWNQRIRFGENQEYDFVEFAESNPKQAITITVKKDNCGDYWIIFKLAYSKIKKSGIYTYVPGNIKKDKEIGLDVGIKDLIIQSDGTKYSNERYGKKNKSKMKSLSRRLSRRWGYANEKFRDKRKNDKNIIPSKRYMETQKKLSKLHRQIARKREHYNNEITKKIINDNSFIAVETLNVKGMVRNRHLAFALHDAAIGSVLQKIKYKADWYDRIVKAIDQWTPSTQLCSCCGHRYKDIALSVREWKCPQCGAIHDRDINAAKNILKFAKIKNG